MRSIERLQALRFSRGPRRRSVDERVVTQRRSMDCKPSVSTSVRSRSGNRRRSSVAAPSSFSLVAITSNGEIAATMARKCKALVWSKRLRNHPCPSVTTSGVVINRGGSENSLAKRACHRSDRSANAMSAEVSTFASALFSIYNLVDLRAGVGVARLEHAGVAHPGFGAVYRLQRTEGSSEQLRKRDT